MARIRYSFRAKLSDDDAVGGAVLVERVGAEEPALVRHHAVLDCEPDVQERWVVTFKKRKSIGNTLQGSFYYSRK